MPKPPADYFRYVPVPKAAHAWGIAVSAAGRSHVPPGSRYPMAKHPDDHTLDWSRGRVLESLQIVLITAGRGRFETRPSHPQVVEAGNAFMLFPGVWHRYQPDRKTGWDESWVELVGPTVQRLLRDRTLTPKRPVLAASVGSRLEYALDAVHSRLRASKLGIDSELAARGLATLAAWKEAEAGPRYESRMNKAIDQAVRHFADKPGESINVSALARRLGVAYSHFRNSFRIQTGYSPWQYVIHLRLTEGKRLLAGSDATLDEIAARLGFNSAFHFSATFKSTFGISPTHWRRRINKDARAPSIPSANPFAP